MSLNKGVHRPIRICHLISGLGPGGAQSMLCNLVAGMDRRQFHNVVLSLTDEALWAPRIEDVGVQAVSLHMKRGRPSLAGLRRLILALRRLKPDILQTWLSHADLAGLIAAQLSGVPIVIWNLRNSYIDYRRSKPLAALTLKTCARLSQRPSAVIVNSQSGRDSYREIGYAPREWVVIPNGIDIRRFKPSATARTELRTELGMPQDAKLIGLIARYSPEKDHPTFLRAAEIVLRTSPETMFVLVGDGVTESNNALFGSLNGAMKSRMRILGPRSDVSHVAAALDVAVSSSYSEGFPNSIAEAMAGGVPCVVTNCGDSADIVGPTGLVVPTRNPVALAQACVQLLLSGENSRRQLGRAARARVMEFFSLEQATGKYQELYHALGQRTEKSPCVA